MGHDDVRTDRLTPRPERMMEIQVALEDLASRVAEDPGGVLVDVEPLLAETATWSRLEASLWCAQLTAQALRFLDHLEQAVMVAQGGIQIAGDRHPAIRAHLALEAGSSLNQAGEQARAEGYLRDSVRCFEAIDDDAGRAWALTALADALCGLSRATEAGSAAEEAVTLARAAGDVRIELRALKQLAVVHRQLGQTALALAAIDEVLARTPQGHSRGNALLEQGHLLSQVQDLAGAESSYLDAAMVYTRFEDTLGLANVYRALGNGALLLGRFSNGVEHLRRAAEMYEAIDNRQGLGYTLRDLAIIEASDGSHDRAEADARRAVGCFQDTGDLLGLTGSLRALARVMHTLGRQVERDEAIAQAQDAAARSGSPLAVAGAALMRSETAEDLSARRAASQEATLAYLQVGVPLGAAHARTFGARAAWEAGATGEALYLARSALEYLHEARRLVADGSRRADLDFTSRDVTRDLLDLLSAMGKETSAAEVARLAMDVVLDDMPLGLRQGLTARDLSSAVREVLGRIQHVKANAADGAGGANTSTPAHLSQQLAVALTALEPGEPVDLASLDQVRASEPEAAVLVLGAPTAAWQVPVAFALPGAAPSFVMVKLDETDVGDIDALGKVGSTGTDYERLAGDQAALWTARLGQRLLPGPLTDWVCASAWDSWHGREEKDAKSLRVLTSSALAHLPVEALDVNGVPLGVRLAVARVPTPPSGVSRAPVRRQASEREWAVYLDGDLAWHRERSTLQALDVHVAPADAPHVQDVIGEDRLILLGSHGSAGLGLTGGLYASDGTFLLDAADLLAGSMSGSVLVLESCWSGRFVGPRTGEQLTLASVGLLAGAEAVVAGVFGLPADAETTGCVMATLITELSAGVAAPEAARRARAAYWRDAPATVRRPSGAGAGDPARPQTMSGRSPLAWAGLCVWVAPS